MRSPFPGVDPYLEAQGYWPDFHLTFIGSCREAIADRLPDHYEARIDERIRLVGLPNDEAKVIRPGVAVVGDRPAESRRAAAVAVLDPEPITIPVLSFFEEVREAFIEIIHRVERTLVAVVEVLSPDNKVESGRGPYLGERNDLFRRAVHLIEFDFLVGGRRLPMGRPLPAGDAYAIVSHWVRRPNCEVYAWSIRRTLTSIRFPLIAPDPDLLLDLAAVYATAFERGRYARSIDYAAPLSIPLAPDDRAWAEDRARSPR